MTRVDQHCEPWKMKPWNEPSQKKQVHCSKVWNRTKAPTTNMASNPTFA
jgi:hypothetical protein